MAYKFNPFTAKFDIANEAHAHAASSVSYDDPTYTNVDAMLDYVGAALSKLIPAKPPNLDIRTLSISSTYTAREAGTGTSRSSVINNLRPTATLSGSFYDGDSGTLTALVDGVSQGARALTTGSDVGTYSALNILTDVDYYAGQSGKEGFWKVLTASMQATGNLSSGSHTYQMSHSTTGSTPALSFYVDNVSGSPTVTSATFVSGTATANKKVSGVPVFTTGDILTVSATFNNTVSAFYNNSQVGRFSGSYVNTLNWNPASPPTSGATLVSGNQNVTISSGYTTNATVTATAYNSSGGTGTATITPSSWCRVDSVSTEINTRRTSGTGQYPTTGYGTLYDAAKSAESLLTAGNEELFMENNQYKYPSTNFSANYLPGPNYSGITGWRYATFNLGTVTNITGRTITINGSNLSGTPPLSNFRMYVKVEGVTGWVDANASYPGVGSPVNDGDAAMAPGSTATSRIVTFGSTPRSGTLYVRIGLLNGSSSYFTGVS